ncbi:OmpA family protein [Bradyrhizobium oligotrophicum]|uniref:OmpA family protein n=1 Tax=Bradyrhizobium oligotrophicum TaxID=44255 RepID=UPI003EC0286F
MPPAGLRIDSCIVAGEEAPAWLAAAFAIAGTLIAMMSAALWQQSVARPPQAQAPVAFAAAPPEPAREASTADAAPRRPEAPSPEPAPTMAAPRPVIAAVAAEPPAPPSAAVLPPVAQAATSTARAAERGDPAPACFGPLSILFERGSARPNPADIKRSLAVLQRWLAQHRGATIIIEGHTDATGGEELNVLLSYSRAKAVAALLKQEGIATDRMSVRAAGSGEARGNADAAAGERSALLRIAGVDDCNQLTATKRP